MHKRIIAVAALAACSAVFAVQAQEFQYRHKVKGMVAPLPPVEWSLSQTSGTFPSGIVAGTGERSYSIASFIQSNDAQRLDLSYASAGSIAFSEQTLSFTLNPSAAGQYTGTVTISGHDREQRFTVSASVAPSCISLTTAQRGTRSNKFCGYEGRDLFYGNGLWAATDSPNSNWDDANKACSGFYRLAGRYAMLQFLNNYGPAAGANGFTYWTSDLYEKGRPYAVRAGGNTYNHGTSSEIRSVRCMVR